VVSRQPLLTSAALALGAVAIPTTVVGDGLIATVRALVTMSAQDCGTAVGNGLEDLAVQPVNPPAMVHDEATGLWANDIGHLQGWPGHFFSSLRERWTCSRLETSRASSGLAMACRCFGDRCR